MTFIRVAESSSTTEARLPPGLASSKAEQVFTMQGIYTHTCIHVHTNTWLATQTNTDRKQRSQNQMAPVASSSFHFLTYQDESVLVENIYTYGQHGPLQ